MNGPELTTDKAADRETLARYESVLRYEAGYLIDKLVKERIVDSPEEGESLFAEVKKFLILSYVDSDVTWNMYSVRIDEAWHQFVLFTRQYTDFCRRYFGEYVHHIPSGPLEPLGHATRRPSTFEAFRARYESFFGNPLPDVWLDGLSISLSRRVINYHAGRGLVSAEGGMACLKGPAGNVDVLVSDIARNALEFVAQTSSFYVRELPGDLTDDEKVGLIATLVEHRILRVAP
ncbi:hypothetical protein B0G81_7888 [Paraburkholderia sp. BL6665CI2N2]|nr:hypothetical protein B0G81_7888 [Paraburkholderia sp. BL6665CI2N2]